MHDLSSDEVLGSGVIEDGAYKLKKRKGRVQENEGVNKSACNLESSRTLLNQSMNDELSLLHVRLYHLSLGKMKHLKCWKFNEMKKCYSDSCYHAKFHKLPFVPSSSITENPSDLLHVDL